MTHAPFPKIVARICRRFAGWICAGVLLSGIAVAQAPPGSQILPTSDGSQSKQAGDEEPITPVPQPPPADPLKLALGERLFRDPRLSANGNIACSSCHDISANGAGGNERLSRKDGSQPPVDTLTVFNAALSFRLTWKGRYRTLAEQAEASIQNPANMNSSLADVARRLDADAAMAMRFRVAYGREPDRDNVLDALVTFERSLLTPDSRFDHWLAGEATALTPAEVEGYGMFKSFGCSSCHQGVNAGGNLFARLGIFHQLVEGSPSTMRVPSLRNVAATAPYFHDGSAATLEDAVRRMATAQLDRTLTDRQIASLVSFLGTLTGNYRGKPVAGGER